MNKICALQMDPIETINVQTDSTFILGIEALRRGYTLYHYEVADLFYEDGEVFAFMRQLTLHHRENDHFTWVGERRKVNLKTMDVIWLRQDPPFDMCYITNTHMLDLVDGHAKVVNRPSAVRNAPEKILVTHFPELCAPTLIARNRDVIKKFRDTHKDIIIKPLYSSGGRGVFHIKPEDENLSTLLDVFFDTNKGEPIIAQKFLPEIAQGDKRIILINGEAKACINRIAQHGEVRANLHAGGTFDKEHLSAQDINICQTIGQYLRDNGLIFVGIDVIGGYLTEINVTSPTCIQEINTMYSTQLERDIWDAVENTP